MRSPSPRRSDRNRSRKSFRSRSRDRGRRGRLPLSPVRDSNSRRRNICPPRTPRYNNRSAHRDSPTRNIVQFVQFTELSNPINTFLDNDSQLLNDLMDSYPNVGIETYNNTYKIKFHGPAREVKDALSKAFIELKNMNQIFPMFRDVAQNINCRPGTRISSPRSDPAPRSRIIAQRSDLAPQSGTSPSRSEPVPRSGPATRSRITPSRSSPAAQRKDSPNKSQSSSSSSPRKESRVVRQRNDTSFNSETSEERGHSPPKRIVKTVDISQKPSTLNTEVDYKKLYKDLQKNTSEAIDKKNEEMKKLKDELEEEKSRNQDKDEEMREVEDDNKKLQIENKQLREAIDCEKEKQTKAMDQIRSLHDEREKLEEQLKHSQHNHPGEPVQPSTSTSAINQTRVKTEPNANQVPNSTVEIENIGLRLENEKLKQDLKKEGKKLNDVSRKYLNTKKLLHSRDLEISVLKDEKKRQRDPTLPPKDVETVTLSDNESDDTC